MARELSAEERATFQRDGVVLLRAAVAPAWVGRMLAAVERLHAAPSPATRRGTRPFGMDRHLYPGDPEFRAFVFETGLARLAADAMGSAGARIYFDQLVVKEPEGDDVFHWHQDHPFWPIEGTQVASTWVALTAASVETSALEFVKGSHRWGTTFRPYFPPERTREALNRVWPDFGDYVHSFPDEIRAFEDDPTCEVIGFDVQPGDALLFDYRLLHRSRANTSPHRRVAVSYRWLGDDAVWQPVPGADPVISQEHTWLAPGAPITDDAAFPLVHDSRRAARA